MSSQCRERLLLVVVPFAFLFLIQAPTLSRAAEPNEQPAAKKADAEPVIAVTHQDEPENGWFVAETTNFILYHMLARDLAASILQTAERTRAAQLKKWFGEDGNWQRKCRLILYPSGQAYGEATGAPVHPVGGHTEITAEEGRVLSRCIHMHGRRTFLLKGILPHEVTHAVLAGRLSSERMPRWADEGMAILAESQAHIDVHYRQLPRWRDDEALFSVRELIEMRDYPHPRSLGIFYAQSVSLVDFLTQQKGAKHFARFVRDGERDGYTASLRKHYGWTFAELDRRWQHHAFAAEKPIETATPAGE
jgi:hypothetical protein